jgi:hypothetical protein
LTLEQFQESAKNKTCIAPKRPFQATDITNGTGKNTQKHSFHQWLKKRMGGIAITNQQDAVE